MKSPVTPAKPDALGELDGRGGRGLEAFLVAVDVEQQVMAEGRLRKGLRRVAPVHVFDLRDAPVAAPDEGIGGRRQARLGEDHVGRALAAEPGLAQRIADGKPRGRDEKLRVARETDLRRDRADERRVLPKAAGQGKTCKADEGKAGDREHEAGE